MGRPLALLSLSGKRDPLSLGFEDFYGKEGPSRQAQILNFPEDSHVHKAILVGVSKANQN